MKQRHHINMDISDARSLAIWLSVIAVVMPAFAVLYIPMNIQSPLFWVWLCFGGFAIAVVLTLFGWIAAGDEHTVAVRNTITIIRNVIVIGIIAFLSIGGILSTPLFGAGAYAVRIQPQGSSWDEWSGKMRMDGISLMDTSTATTAGNRELGSLSDVVNKYDDGEYQQEVVNGKPAKVSALKYATGMQALMNASTGTPGYVTVDPVKQDADYHSLDGIDGTGNGMVYVPSGFLLDNLAIHLHMQYPTWLIGNTHFELDEDGHPFYVSVSYHNSYALFGAPVIDRVIVTDPTNGDSTDYAPEDAPDWVDDIYDGEYLVSAYNDYGMYSGGFLNSMFGQSGCTKVDDDYGYVMIDGEQYIYTGITSMNSDASNIAFLLASERTGKAYTIPMPAADESSAMDSAKGKVQQYGYDASFPSLVSIDGQATYVMVLKDSANLIRKYAMVNAESYNVVAVEDTLEQCRSSYEDAMRQAGISFEGDGQEMPTVSTDGEAGSSDGKQSKDTEFSTTVAVMQLADKDGTTYAYILGDDGNLYVVGYADNAKALMTLSAGKAISGTAHDDGRGSMIVTTFVTKATAK